jgi:hypothetical protein
MPRLIVSIDGVVVKEVQLTKDRSSIGRRPYNDIVIDNLAVSGEHAVIHLASGHATLEDLGSTNGTYVNGKAIKKQVLANDDLIEIGKYKAQYFENDGHWISTKPAPTVAERLAAAEAEHIPTEPTPARVAAPGNNARVRVLNGPNAGQEMPLTKVVTTLGKPGLSVASLTRKLHGYDIAHVEGDAPATVNGVPVSDTPLALKNNDQIELGGVRLEFLDR